MRNDEKTTIVILMYQYSIIVKGMEKKLQDLGYHVIVHVGNVAKLAGYMERTSLVIAYMPKDIAEKITGDEIEINDLTFTEDIVRKYECPMLVVGEKQDHSKFVGMLPAWKHYEWIDRPVKMNLLELAVDKQIKASCKKGEKRILIVDDDRLYANMVGTWLSDVYSTFIITDGRKVFSFLEQTKVDLILLDYEMPIFNGPQVLQMLRQDPETREIPVIFLTGVDTKESVMRVVEMKPTGYILKSTGKEKLLSYLQEKI